MPIYEYACDKCGEEFEKLVHAGQKVTCTKCGSEDIRKKFSVFGMSGVQNPGSSGCTSCSSGSCASCK